MSFEMLRNRTVLAMYTATLITIVELYALHQGIDGQLFVTVIALIAGLGGFSAGRWVKQEELEP